MLGRQDQDQNLLGQHPLEPQQHVLKKQAMVRQEVKTSKASIAALYGLLIFLTIALLLQIVYLFRHTSIDIEPNNSSSITTEKQSLPVKQENQQRSHRLGETKLKQLKLIELERQIIKLNRMIQSKSELNQNLIATQLQKQHKIKLKYWDLQQETKEKVEERRKQNNDSAYISKHIEGEQISAFPKIVWMYIEQNITTQSNLTQLLISNLAEYLQLQGYDFYLIGEYNFRYLMSNRHEEQLGYVLTDLWHLAYETNLTKNLKDHTFTIKKHLISLIMLSELGGILIDKDLILTQDLSWLHDIKRLGLANRGRSEQPNIIGFYHVNYTESIDQIQVSQFEKKQVHLYPPLDPYFIAVSRKGASFISEVLQRYYVLLQFPEKVKSILKDYQLRLKQISGQDPYYQAIFIASSWVLRRKQIQLDIQWQKSGKQSLRPLAIDHYGIYLFNRVYGPLKYRFLFSQNNKQDIYSYFSKLNYSELAGQYGAVSFATFLAFQDQIDKYIFKAVEGEEDNNILQDSLLGRFVYKGQNESWIVDKDITKRTFEVESGVKWNIPKKVWVYLNAKSIVSELCLHNILLASNQSKFELVVLNDSNLNNYISSQTLAKMRISFQGQKLRSQNIRLSNVWVQLVKLAIMYEQGGIWLDLPMFTLANFDWVINIHQNKRIINRSGRLPSILLFYHPIESGFPYSCHDQDCEVRDQLSFATTFIAAQPKTKCLSLWLQQMLKNIMLYDSRFNEKLATFNISYKSLNSGAQLSKISLKWIIEAQNRQLSTKPNIMLKQFKIWSLSSFSGLDKLKQYTNFDVGFNPNNIYLWSHPISKVTSLLGSFDYLIHLSKQEQEYLNRELVSPKTIFIHPNSFLVEHVLDFTLLDQLISNQGNNKLQLVSLGPIQFPRLIWVYLQNAMQQDKKWLQNNIHYCQGYSLQIVNSNNYQQFISEGSTINSLLQLIPKLQCNQETKQKLKQELIIYAVIYSRGGIFIQKDVFLTQDIGWINHLKTNKYVGGSKDSPFNFFFHKQYSSSTNKKQEREKYLRSFFFAAAKQSLFLSDVLHGYEQLLKRSVKNNLYFISSSQIFHTVLGQMYEGVSNKDKFEGFLKNYGIATMDSTYFAQKLYHYSIQQTVNLLARMSYQRVKQLMGPLSYMIRFNGIYELLFIIKYKKIEQHSFLVDHFHFKKLSYKFTSNEAKSVGSRWEKLPKTMWFYLQGKQYSLLDELNKGVVQKYCNQLSIGLMVIKASTIDAFIEPEVLATISDKVNGRNQRIQQQIQQNLKRLALLVQHGGIFLSSHYIPTQNFSWIFNPPSNAIIYNRYEAPPNVLHLCNSNHFQSNIDGRYGVRVANASTLSFEFMAANKNNQFLLALFQQILQLLGKNDQTLNFKLSKVGLDETKWQVVTPSMVTAAAYLSLITKRGKELTIADGVDRMHQVLRRDKIWTLVEQSGPTKLSQPYFQNAEQLYELICMRNGDEVDEIFGPPQFLISTNNVIKSAVERGGCHQASYIKRYLNVK